LGILPPRAGPLIASSLSTTPAATTRRDALDAIGGFDTEFHGEDTNLGRRLHARGDVMLCGNCFVHTSARRYCALGTWAVVCLYVRNVWSEILFAEQSLAAARRPLSWRTPGVICGGVLGVPLLTVALATGLLHFLHEERFNRDLLFDLVSRPSDAVRRTAELAA